MNCKEGSRKEFGANMDVITLIKDYFIPLDIQLAQRGLELFGQGRATEEKPIILHRGKFLVGLSNMVDAGRVGHVYFRLARHLKQVADQAHVYIKNQDMQALDALLSPIVPSKTSNGKTTLVRGNVYQELIKTYLSPVQPARNR